jgi:disulfide bond formation protein DsbB
MMENVLRELQQPEYLHVLLNPLPLYGLAIALFGLIAATYLASRAGQVTALVLVFATAISAWPVVSHGDRAYDRVLTLADEPGQAWLKAHVHRADQFIFLYYALAALAVAAIFVPKKWPRTATPLVFATMLLAIVSLGAGVYIAHAGGKIRHREFRSAPPPQTSPEPR